MSRSTALTVLVASAILGGSLIVAAVQFGRGPRFVPVGGDAQGWSTFVVFDRDAKQVCWAGAIGHAPEHLELVPCYRSHAVDASAPSRWSLAGWLR
jgi:hypothetical protein